MIICCKNSLSPKSITGGTISEYETKKAFKTYKIIRNGSGKVVITL